VVFTSGLLAREEYRLYNAARLAPPLTVLAGLVAIAAASDLTPQTAGLATLAGAVPVCLWLLHRFWTHYRPSREGVGWASGRLLSYGIRSYGVDLLGSLATQIDRVFVMGLLSPAAMGLYIVAVNVALVLNVFPTAAVAVLFPKASGRSVPEVLRLTGRAARVTLLVTGLCAAAGALLAPLLLQVLYGQGFAAAVPVLQLLLVEGVLRAVTWVLAQAFMGLNQPGIVSVVQGVGLAAFIPLLLWLVPRFGVVGAGGALVIATGVRFLFILSCFPLFLKSRPPDLRPRRQDFWGAPRVSASIREGEF
jgi:O-antigen/teichoic acid export membrane protein